MGLLLKRSCGSPGGRSVFDAKLVISIITGAVATAAAVRRDLDTLLAGRRSLVSQIKSEEERIKQIDKSLQALNGDGEIWAAARQALENDRRIAFERLKRLTAEFSRQREDPNYDLSFIQRLFLLFRPESGRAEMIHWLACTFMALGLISVLCWVCLAQQLDQQQRKDLEEFIADFAVLGCSGALLLRAWALAERRWSHHYNCKSSLLNALLVIKGPASARVRWAQVCFWVCLYWVVESLEDFVQAVFSGDDPHPRAALLKLLAPLLTGLLCRYWVVAELKYARTQSMPRCRWSAFFRHGWSTLAVVISVAALAGSIIILVLPQPFFSELEHRIALVLQSLILCFACSRRLALLPRLAVSTVHEPLPTKAQSAAA